MTKSSIEAEERKKLTSLRRRYRRAGYAVRIPKGRDDAPEFLSGYVPDLIAEKEGDCVVIEVKRNKSLRGSNELVAIAERVAAAPGWRFELVTYTDDTDDDILQVPHHGSIRYFKDVADKAYDADASQAGYLYIASIIEVYLRDLAAKKAIDHKKLSASALARELVTLGVISRETLGTINEIFDKRNDLAHRPRDAAASRTELESLTATMQKLQSELISDAA